MKASIGFFGILQIVLVILKIIEKVSWNWLWVFTPLWGGAALVIASLMILAICLSVTYIIDKKIKKEAKK